MFVNIQSIQTTNWRYSQQWCGLEDAILHLQLPNCWMLRRRVAGEACNGWKLQRVAGEACNMTENALSIWTVIFSVHLQQTEISERKQFIFHLGGHTQIPTCNTRPADTHGRKRLSSDKYISLYLISVNLTETGTAGLIIFLTFFSRT